MDWNDDRVFQAEELVYQSGIAGVGEYVTTITVPLGTAPGPKRMRIRLHMPNYNGNSTPCGSNSNGEVQDFTVNVPDLSDIGDTLAMAEPTGIGPAPGNYTHSTRIGNGEHDDKDVDIYRFDAAAGRTVFLSTSLPAGGNPMDTILRLFDASGTQLAVNNDFGGSVYSHIEHTFAAAGTYYAGVSGYPNSEYAPNVAGSGVAGSTGDYTLSLQLNVPQETLYSTGFEPEEGFQLGFIGGQQGWGIWGSSAVQPVISDANPASGSQHLRIGKDPDLVDGALVGCSSADFGTRPPGRYVVSVDVNLSAIGGAGYSVLAYSHSQAANAALVGFYYGLIYIQDAPDGTAQWVNTGKTWNVGTYTNLTIDIHADQDTVDYYYGGELIYSNVAGAFQATSVERVYIRSDNRNTGDVGDFDNLSVRTGGVLGEIRGFKWHDLNGDGVWDAGEPGLEGWEIYLDLNDNGQWDEGEPQTTTGADGSYVFLDLVPGDYNVAEVMQDGWQQTFPSQIMGESSTTHRITVLPGATVEDVNFGNRQVSSDTTTVVTSSANPAIYGDAVFFTATVSAGSGTPTGTVQFVVSGTNLGAPVALSGGTAQSIAVSHLNAATHTVVAQYQPDGGFAPSSGQLAGGQQIDQRPITVTAVTSTKVYDGTTASSGRPTITSGTLAGADTATWTQTFLDREGILVFEVAAPCYPERKQLLSGGCHLAR